MAQRKSYRKIYQENKKNKKLFFLFKLGGGLFLFFALSLLFLFVYYAKDLPRPEKFIERELAQSTKIYERTGKVLLYEIYGEEKRTWVPLEKIPKNLQLAVITAEDANFYHHIGIDFNGIFRSFLLDLKVKKPVYGGSTIPQQLIRSTFLSNKKTIGRKIREIILALELDRSYPKNQILEWYLNQVPFGQNAYGVEAASQTYFKKPVSELDLAESATLAALIRAPYRLSPYGKNKDDLLARKDYILDRMAREGYLSLNQLKEAKEEKLNFAENKIEIKAPYFTLWVKQKLEEKYGQDFLKEEGLKVYTSLDWEMQKIAERAVKEGIERNKKYRAFNGALLALDPQTGQILAMTVGTGNYYEKPYPEGCETGVNCLFDPKFNVIIGTKKNPGRQPGSAFKPFAYAVAFKQKRFDDKFKIKDEETNFGIWGGKEYIPRNYDKRFRGTVTLREALAQSINVPSIKVLYLAGLKNNEKFVDTNNFKGKEKTFLEGLKKTIKEAKAMGITTLNKPCSFYGPSIVLGGGEVKLLDLVSAYGVFATNGFKIKSSPILKIEDQEGNIIEENKNTKERVISSRVAELINDILSDNKARAPLFGWHSSLYFEGYQVAAKTGTTQNYRDAWVLGYTPSIVVGVWVGNNDNTPILKKPGAMVAGPIFHDFLEKILPKYPKQNFIKH